MRVSDRTLVAAALGVLDPGDEAALREGLGPAEHLRQSGLAALAEIPLPNALEAPTVARASGGVLGATSERLRRGDRLSFVLRWPDLPQGARCAVFAREGGAPRLLYPRAAAWTPLQRFRQQDGFPLLQLVVDSPAGHQQIDVVLVAAELCDAPWPADSAAWERLHRGYLEGSGYGVTVEIDVAGS